jgi:hypothetical protein
MHPAAATWLFQTRNTPQAAAAAQAGRPPAPDTLTLLLLLMMIALGCES